LTYVKDKGVISRCRVFLVPDVEKRVQPTTKMVN